MNQETKSPQPGERSSCQSPSQDQPQPDRTLKPHETIMERYFEVILVAIGLLGLVVSLYEWCRYYLHHHILETHSHEEWGQFGDFMGGTLNPILSFLALVALLLTLSVQLKELRLTRKELIDTRTQIERSAAANEDAALASKELSNMQRKSMMPLFFESVVRARTEFKISYRGENVYRIFTISLKNSGGTALDVTAELDRAEPVASIGGGIPRYDEILREKLERTCAILEPGCDAPPFESMMPILESIPYTEDEYRDSRRKQFLYSSAENLPPTFVGSYKPLGLLNIEFTDINAQRWRHTFALMPKQYSVEFEKYVPDESGEVQLQYKSASLVSHGGLHEEENPQLGRNGELTGETET